MAAVDDASGAERLAGHGMREVTVVGSGFGGSVAACRLSQAGYDVLLLERGRRYEKGDFPALPAGRALLPDLTRWTWAHDQGLWDVLDLEEIVSVQAAGYGGGSLIYANVHLRPPPEVFDDAWPRVYRNPDTLKPYFDLAAYMMQAAPITTHAKFRDTLVKSDQLKSAMSRLGREADFFHPPLCVYNRRDPGENVHGVRQSPCTGCGKCSTGCPEGAKNTLDKNYLAVAERFGARVRTQCEVVDVRQDENIGFRVQVVDHLHGNREELWTRYLFLCAGSLHTTRLLLRGEEDPERPESLVGTGYFPGGDALGIVYDAKNPQYPSFGPTITTTTVHFRSVSPASFFQIQDGGYAAELHRLVGSLRAPLWMGRNRLRSETAGAAIEPSRLVPDPVPPPEDVPRIPSPPDALLDAHAEHDFRKIASPQLERAFLPFLKEVQVPLLFPAVAGRTIEDSIEALDRRMFRSVPLFEKNGWLRRTLRGLGRRLVRVLFGDDETIALRALHAMTVQGGLDRSDVAKSILGYDDARADDRVMMLAMGRDAASGQLIYDTARDKLVADLDLFHLAPGYSEEELFMSDVAKVLGGELRTNPAWAFLGKPITVHNQGGCPMADSPSHGVLNEDGMVFGKEGLYVLDGAALCRSVGVNPSATILAVAERNIARFIRAHPPTKPNREGLALYDQQLRASEQWARDAESHGWAITPPRPATPANVGRPFESKPLGLRFNETMQGYFEPARSHPGRHDAIYRRHETYGRPDFPMRMDLAVTVMNLAIFYEDPDHRMELGGSITLPLPSSGKSTTITSAVQGTCELFTAHFKPYGITHDERQRARRQAQIARAGNYRTTPTEPPKERFMTYRFALLDRPGWFLWGYKRMREAPAVDAWRDTSSLFVALYGPRLDGRRGRSVVRGAGVVHVDLAAFLYGQLPSMTVGYASGGAADAPFELARDPALAAWATAKFAAFFFGSLQRIYAPGLSSLVETAFLPHTKNVHYEPSHLRKSAK